MLLVHYALFLFVLFGVKLILALAMIYMLLPTDPRCNGCDEHTLLIQQTGAGRFVGSVTFGYIQRRWCPRCDWYGLARHEASRRAEYPQQTDARSRSI